MTTEQWKLDVAESFTVNGRILRPVCVYKLNDDEEDTDLEMVCECYEGEMEDRIARGRLIAAAPDLLDLVEFLLDHHEPKMLDLMLGEAWVTHARATIAQIKGDAK